MKIPKISFMTAIALLGLFLAGCSRTEPERAVVTEPYLQTTPVVDADAGGDYWAKDNFDLPRVGPLLERSRNAEEFERYLNDRDGINNLDLNDDGYVDYVSVQEFDDRRIDERGLSLFTRYGPDLVQEIATIFFRRDEPGWQGARVMVRGNEQIYGDDVYYETNWADRSVGVITDLFGDRREAYRSPYYYETYPAGYQVYPVVQTPVYRTRVERVFPEPVFIVAKNPEVKKIKIKSPNNGKQLERIFARLANPTPAQVEFIAKNPRRARGRDDRPDNRGGDKREERREDRLDDRRGGDEKRGNDKPADIKREVDPGKGRGDDKGGKPDDKGGKGKKKPD